MFHAFKFCTNEIFDFKLVNYFITFDVCPNQVEKTFAWDDDFVHTILGEITFVYEMFTFLLSLGQSLKMNHKVCNNLCDLKVGWRASSTYMCITHL